MESGNDQIDQIVMCDCHNVSGVREIYLGSGGGSVGSGDDQIDQIVIVRASVV